MAKFEYKSEITTEGRVCLGCEKFKLWKEFHNYKKSKTGHYATCKICINDNHRARTLELKLEVFNHYGRVCYCCKENKILFLQIDHINNNGAEERAQFKADGGINFYQKIKSLGFPEGYQVACANCNTGRHLNGGVCPHEDDDGH